MQESDREIQKREREIQKEKERLKEKEKERQRLREIAEQEEEKRKQVTHSPSLCMRLYVCCVSTATPFCIRFLSLIIPPCP